jgi:hypothetical protein
MSDLFFTIETFSIDDNRELKAITPNEKGFYENLPVAVFSTVTRNNTLYSDSSIVKAITDENSMLKIRINEGTLIGEWGHPIADFNTEFGMQRLATLDPTKEACSISKVSVVDVEDLNMKLITADMKPTGRYGKYFKERIEDPTINLAFSLRSISREKIVNNTRMRDILALITFDPGVSSGGFKQASKRYICNTDNMKVASTENAFAITTEHITSIGSAAMESFTDSELNEMFKSNKVSIKRGTQYFFDNSSETIKDIKNNSEYGVFHTLLNRRR